MAHCISLHPLLVHWLYPVSVLLVITPEIWALISDLPKIIQETSILQNTVLEHLNSVDLLSTYILLLLFILNIP
jgi:hypothetical protein